ncbi:MAG: glycosyltransferase family 2 protein [Kiritimatiellia bacterium]
MNNFEAKQIPVPEFSVIITCYFEEKSIDEFHARLSSAMQKLGRPFEIIFVNDGSTDGTWEHLKAIYEKDSNVTAVIELFRNSGQAAAMVAGFMEASGRNFIFMDSDLQLDPEDLPLLVAKFDEGMDFVSGSRKNRKDSLMRIIPSKIANVIMRRVSNSQLTDFGCTMKIMRNELVRAFHAGPSRNWSLVKVIAQAGRVAEVSVNHHPRKYGKSGWTFRKLFATNMDNLVRLSRRPFQILGLLCLLGALLFIFRVVVGWFLPFSILGDITNGFVLNALIVSLFIVVAILCAIGEFVIRSFLALQRDPIYIVKEILKKEIS